MDECARSGTPVPDRIANAPTLHLGLELYYGAFLDLNTCRPSGWGVMPIPWTIIIDYAEMNGIEGELRDDLLYFVRAMDQAFIERYNKKQNQKGDK